MQDILVLSIVVHGTNVMGRPLLKAEGMASFNGHHKTIDINIPVTSVKDVVAAIEDLFKEERR